MKTKTIIGVMTGTSLDGIDLAIVKFWQNNESRRLEIDLLAAQTYSFPVGFRNELERLMKYNIPVSFVSQANYMLADIFAKNIKEMLVKEQIDFGTIDAVSIHGQTVWHNPIRTYFVDAEIASTMQLTNASALSALLGKPVISDFRAADIALGGQGAPLVPIFDYYFLKNPSENIVALNIGGMANITYISENNLINDVVAFDTGPGNILIDYYMQHLFNLPYDDCGQIAKSGKVLDSLLNHLLDYEYFLINPPKSCGREQFNSNYVEVAIKKSENSYENCDLIRTLTEFTAKTIALAIISVCKTGKVILKGGGGKNLFLIALIQNYLGDNFTIIKSDDVGISSQYYEAIAFAFLGWLTLNNLPANLPHVTGATKSVVLGSVSNNITN